MGSFTDDGMKTEFVKSGSEKNEEAVKENGYVVESILYEADFDIAEVEAEFPEEFKHVLTRVNAEESVEMKQSRNSRNRKLESKKSETKEEGNGEYDEMDYSAAIPINHDVFALWKRDGKFHEAKILESRKKVSGLMEDRDDDEEMPNEISENAETFMQDLRKFHQDHEYMYYVHFVECNV